MGALRAGFVSSVLLAAGCSVGQAQGIQVADPVPAELVVGLLGGLDFGGGGETGLILPGVAPAGNPLPTAIPDGRLVGSFAHGDAGTLVFLTPLGPPEALQTFGDLLRVAGWETNQNMMPGGFQFPSLPLTESFCLGREVSAYVSVIPRGNGETFVRAGYGRMEGSRSPCTEPGFDRGVLSDAPIPNMAPPPSAEVVDASMSGGSMAATTYTILKTGFVAAAVAEHYGRLLQAAGWRLQSSDQGLSSVVQQWQHSTIVGRLLIAPIAETGLVEVNLQLTDAGRADNR